jgi:hypothetical protein
MHPLGWIVKYFGVALVSGIAVDQAIESIKLQIGEPFRGLIFRDSVHNDRNSGDDA